MRSTLTRARIARSLAAFVALSTFAAPLLVSSSALAAPDKPQKTKGQKADGKKKKPKKGAAAPAPAPAAPAKVKAEPEETAPPIKVELALERATLDNGLRVVINVDHSSPTVGIAVSYDVGARDEEKGRSGFAHLFEHMMFQGSANVGKGEHMTLVAGHGGSPNGTTNGDRTSYFEGLPQNELALGLWLEADRMKSLDISEANFENQRKVVQEEFRMRISNQAYGPSDVRLEELVFQGYWPYEHPAIGSMPDLDAAQLDWVKDFHDHHYGPNNAVLVVSGDVDAAEAMAMVHKYFDPVPKVTITPFTDVPLPEQTSQRTAVLTDDHARTSAVHMGWAIPAVRTADHYALDLASMLLGEGESSRLHQLLVRDKGWAQSVHSYTADHRGPDIFTVGARLTEKGQIPEVQKAIEDQIKQLATKGPSSAEMKKAHRRAESAVVMGLQSNLSRARKLADFELFHGDARELSNELPKYFAVTSDDIKRVTAKYLGPLRRTVIETNPTDMPEKPKAEPAKAAAPAKAPAKAAPAKKGAKAKKKKPS